MARKRMVSPDLLTSESLASLPVVSRYAFIALWMYVDDYGRGKDSPALIKAHTWPLDDDMTTETVREQLDGLESVGSICRYEVDGGRFLHVPTWVLFQKVSHATDSKLPVCPGERYQRGHEAYTRSSRANRERVRVDQFSSGESRLGESDGTPPDSVIADLRSQLRKGKSA